MTLTEALQASRCKVDEAAFFLAKMREVEASSHNNLATADEQFGYYLSGLSFQPPDLLSRFWPTKSVGPQSTRFGATGRRMSRRWNEP